MSRIDDKIAAMQETRFEAESIDAARLAYIEGIRFALEHGREESLVEARRQYELTSDWGDDDARN